MLQFDLNADVRNDFGKGASRSLRRGGQTPAILYGPNTEAMPLTLEAKSLTRTLVSLQGRNAVFTMEINDGSSSTKRHAIVKELQSEPVSGALVHTDFLEVKLDEPRIFNVPINYTGIAKGAELGGEIHIPLAFIKLKGLILDMPDSVELDISALDIGERLLCGAIEIPSGIEMLNGENDTCILIVTAAREPEVDEEDESEAVEGDDSATEEGPSEENAS